MPISSLLLTKWLHTNFYNRIFHSLRMEGNKMTFEQVKKMLQTGERDSNLSDHDQNEVESMENAFRSLSTSAFNKHLSKEVRQTSRLQLFFN